MKKRHLLLLGALCIVFAVVFILSGLQLYDILHGYKAAEKRYDSLASAVFSMKGESGEEAPSSSEQEVVTPAPSSVPDGETPAPQDDGDGYGDGGGDQGGDGGVYVDFEKIEEVTNYVIGWLYLPNSVINYPVAQYSDNSFFLDHYIDGSYSAGGALFADCACESDFSSQNTVIYGHHMMDGSMLAGLDRYASQDYYNSHRVMYLYTEDQNYEIQIFSAFTTSSTSRFYTTYFPYRENYENHLSELKNMSELLSDVEVGPDDRIVTLSTCAYSFEDARYIVVGKLVPID